MVDRYFQCYKCHYNNNFNDIPFHIKGKKCKKCHSFNFFKHYKKNQKNNFGLTIKKQFFKPTKKQRNRLGNNNHFNHINFYNDNSYSLISSNTNNNNNNILLNNNNNNSYEDDNDNDETLSYNNLSNHISELNYHIQFNFNSLNQINEINQINNNNINNNEEELVDNNINKISWLKRERAGKSIIKKYGKDCTCSICLETIKRKEDINITKCNHIFHYKCIEKSINKHGLDCPNCRSNLKDGPKKSIDNNDNRLNDLGANNNNNNNNNINNNRYYAVGSNSYENDSIRDHNNDNSIKNYVIIYFVVLVFLGILDGLSKSIH